MKGKFIMLLLMLASLQAQAQTIKADTPTRVILIGVVHQESKWIRSDSLLAILTAINPQVILDESDTLSSLIKKDGSLTKISTWYKVANKLGLARKLSPETQVLYLYRYYNNDVILHPFDITIPNRNQYIKEKNKDEKQLGDAINKAFYNNAFSAYRKNIHDSFRVLNKQFFAIFEKGYYDINQPAVTENIRQMMALEVTHYPAIMDSVASVAPFKAPYLTELAFWDKRNKTMADNILRFVAQYPGKTIVVLTGVFHKYYLFDLLLPKQSEYGFTLHEYYDL